MCCRYCGRVFSRPYNDIFGCLVREPLIWLAGCVCAICCGAVRNLFTTLSIVGCKSTALQRFTAVLALVGGRIVCRYGGFTPIRHTFRLYFYGNGYRFRRDGVSR